jgi:hypothetical protein
MPDRPKRNSRRGECVEPRSVHARSRCAGCSPHLRVVAALAAAVLIGFGSAARENDMAQTYTLTETVSVRIGAPVVVAVSRPGETRWGFHQFPALSPLPDGRILCTFNKQRDAVAAYGGASGAYVSADHGATWKRAKVADLGLIAPHPAVSPVFDGEYLCAPATAAFDAKKHKVELPEPVAQFHAYTNNSIYRLADFPKQVREHFAALPAYRWTPETKEWRKTTVKYDTKGMLLWARAEGDEQFLLPRTWFERRLLKVGEELLYADYRARYRLDDGSRPKHHSSTLMVSTDNGRSFQRRATIATDRKGKDAMCEPRLALNARGELVCVIRRVVSGVQRPMMITYSKDAGRTWTKPRALFEFGVWPSLVSLECGVMALSFGRPGVHLSFSPNGGGRTWTDPLTVRKGNPKKVTTKTCGYSDLLALDADSFLIAYSDFEHKDKQGQQRKAILVRRVDVRVR